MAAAPSAFEVKDVHVCHGELLVSYRTLSVANNRLRVTSSGNTIFLWHSTTHDGLALCFDVATHTWLDFNLLVVASLHRGSRFADLRTRFTIWTPSKRDVATPLIGIISEDTRHADLSS